MAEADGFWMETTSLERAELLYSLQLGLPPELDVQDLSVWKISAEVDDRTAELKARGLTAQCWVHAADLDGDNSLFDVCQRGFVVGEDGLELEHGSLLKDAVVEDAGKAVQCVVCEVFVGKSACCEAERKPVEGYDSLSVVAEQSRSYVVFGDQVVVKYVARLKVVRGSDLRLLESQEPKPEYFDPVALMTVTMTDKMTGSHASGEMARHRLVPVEEAYHDAASNTGSVRRMALTDQLSAVDSKLREVNLNFSEVQGALYETLQSALRDLQLRTKEKVADLLAVELGIRTHLDTIDRGEARVAHLAHSATTEGDRGRCVVAWAAHRRRTQPPAAAAATATAANYAKIRSVTSNLELRGSVSIVDTTTPQDDDNDFVQEAGSTTTTTGATRALPRAAPRVEVEVEEEPVARRKHPSELLLMCRRYDSHSLSKLAERKRRQLPGTLAVGFTGSRLAKGDAASWLFLALPSSSSPPNTRLVCSKKKKLTSLVEAMSSCREPVVFLARSGEFIFGAFTAEPGKKDGVAFGSPRAFLFSLTCDIKLPYHGAKPLEKKHGCVRATKKCLHFGNGDLVLSGERLGECESNLEQIFGLGLDPGLATTLLAGAKTFAIDEFELWAIS